MVKKFLSKGAYHYPNDFFNDKIGFVILGGNMMRVIKRNGHTVDFDATKIENAILKAMKCGSGIIDEQCAKDIARGPTDLGPQGQTGLDQDGRLDGHVQTTGDAGPLQGLLGPIALAQSHQARHLRFR